MNSNAFAVLFLLFVTHLLASLASKRRDAVYIEIHMTDWMGIVQESPEYPGILSSVGHCASIIENSLHLEELLTLSLVRRMPKMYRDCTTAL